jgi:hypothetical protein
MPTAVGAIIITTSSVRLDNHALHLAIIEMVVMKNTSKGMSVSIKSEARYVMLINVHNLPLQRLVVRMPNPHKNTAQAINKPCLT